LTIGPDSKRAHRELGAGPLHRARALHSSSERVPADRRVVSRVRVAAGLPAADVRVRQGMLAADMLPTRRDERSQVLPDPVAELAERFAEDYYQK